MTTSITQSKSSKRVKKIISAAFWLAVWYSAAIFVGQELIIPTPLAVIKTLFELARQSLFWQATFLSLLRIFGGYVIGIVLGTVLAVLTTRFELMDALFSPIIRIIRATPVASFIILALLWINHSIVPALMSTLMVIPIVWGSLCTAIAETDKDLLEMAKLYRFKMSKTIKLIYIPSALPSFRSACNTSIGLAWKSGIAAEVLCLPRISVGTYLYYSKIYLETSSLFAWTVVVIILSFALEKLFGYLFRKRGAIL